MRQMLTVGLLFLAFQVANTISNQELPELIRRNYFGVASRIINVTVGE